MAPVLVEDAVAFKVQGSIELTRVHDPIIPLGQAVTLRFALLSKKEAPPQ
jgi:hypothetical protein